MSRVMCFVPSAESPGPEESMPTRRVSAAARPEGAAAANEATPLRRASKSFASTLFLLCFLHVLHLSSSFFIFFLFLFAFGILLNPPDSTEKA